MEERSILIKIDEQGMSYETDLPMEEVVFWLEVCKSGIISYAFDNNANGVIDEPAS